MAQVKFRKVNGIATSGLETGCIYFDKKSGVIHVATSATETDKFGIGVKDAKLENSILTITRWDNTEVTVDFSDIASASSVVAALALKADKTQVAADIAAAQAAAIAAAKVKDVDTTVTNGINLSVDANGKLDVTVSPGAVADGNASVVTGDAVYDAITAEAGRAAEAEAALGSRVATIEGLLAEDGNDTIDNLKDVIDYFTGVKETETGAALISDVATIKSSYVKSVKTTDGSNGYVELTPDTAATGEVTIAVDDSAIANKFIELEDQINNAVAGSVTSFGSKTGAITVKGSQTANGSVNLTMSNNELQASIVGLGSAAYTNVDAYDAAGTAAAAVAELDADVASTNGSYVTVKVTEVNGKITAVSVNDDAVKDYADARETAANAYTDSALTWVEFE